MASFPDGNNLPAYLRSLESMLGGSGGPTTTGTATVVPTPQPSPVAPTATATSEQPSTATSAAPLSLSSIGFGNLFTGAGAATRGLAATAAPSDAAAPEKLRFLLASTHCQQVTGYSKVSYGILQELAKESSWLDVTHYGFQRLPKPPAEYRPLPSTITQIDAAALERPGPGQPSQGGFGFSALPDVIRQKKPHVVMIYNDLAVVHQYLAAIKASGIQRNFKLWVYVDQVYTVQNQVFIDMLNRDVDRIFAFSAGWKRCLKDQGITRPVDVLTHAFNKSQFFPIPRDLARQQAMIPKDIFLFLNLNRNQPRKRYDILLMAFVELVVKYPTKPLFLLCVCDKGDAGGWWLFEIFARELRLRGVPVEQFGNRLIVTSQNMSFKDEEINMFYNAADVGITTADGEGWGLCQFEQMGVGVPQVVPDILGFQEFCTPENSVMVKPKVRYYLPTAACPVGGEAFACDPHDVCVAMEEYVLNSEKRAAHGKAAKEKVQGYTWAKSVEGLLRRLRQAKEDDD